MARKFVEGQLGLFKPESSWERPTELPDLRGRPVVAIDTENRDDGLARGRGPGWPFVAGGHVCGVSWAAEGSVGYAPIRHPNSDCFDEDAVRRWLRDLFESGTRIVFHNSPYDVGWLGTFGVAPPRVHDDTMAAAVMLDETLRRYNLDDCCARAGVPGKDLNLLRQAVEAAGGDPRRPAESIWRLEAKYAGVYAEADAAATLALWHQQEGQLRAQEVWDAYRTEMELVPMVVAMRRRGIRIDVEAAERAGLAFRARREAILAELTRQLGGRRVDMEDVRSPDWLERAHAGQGIRFPKTAGGKQGSFQKEWMEKHEHWLPRLVTAARAADEAAEKFVFNYLLSYAERGRLHAEVHQFLSDDGGTRSHRFSYSEPPLQQMPSPDKDPRDEAKRLIEDRAVGTLIRRCFLPEEGEHWGASDYSQQEPRLTVHYASVCKARGAEAAVLRYLENPRTDYHQMVADITGFPRWRAKIFNLAMTYGKGDRATAEELGVSLEEGREFLKLYHERLPYIKSLEEICKGAANRRGYIRLIDGARMRYTQWEGGWVEWEDRKEAEARGKKLSPCSLEEARARQADPTHPWSKTRLRRADTRKSLNNLIQGSAARQTKIAMRNMWREGILPLIQMHDEVGASVPDRRTHERIGEIMRDAVPTVVPMVVDLEVGRSWGDAKKSWDDYERMAA